MIPQPPYILCSDEKAANMVRAAIHEDWARQPPVVVAEEWPCDWEVNAVVVTPINVIGTEGYTSFSIDGDFELSDRARKVLNAYINLMRAKGGGNVSYREIGNAIGFNRRKVTSAIRELEEAGVGSVKGRNGFSVDIGSWRPDSNKARAIGLKITEYD